MFEDQAGLVFYTKPTRDSFYVHFEKQWSGRFGGDVNSSRQRNV